MEYRLWMPYSSENENKSTIFPSEFHINGLSPREASRRLKMVEAFDRWDSQNKAIYLHPGEPVTDHLDCSGTRVVSRRLKELLEPLTKDKAQFLSIRLELEDGSGGINGYYVMHVLAAAEVLDFGKIEYDLIAGRGPEVILKPWSPVVLRRHVIPPDLQVFKDSRWYGNNLIVRDDLANALKQARITGLLFKSCRYS